MTQGSYPAVVSRIRFRNMTQGSYPVGARQEGGGGGVRPGRGWFGGGGAGRGRAPTRAAASNAAQTATGSRYSPKTSRRTRHCSPTVA